jgi:hypothetical protein
MWSIAPKQGQKKAPVISFKVFFFSLVDDLNDFYVLIYKWFFLWNTLSAVRKFLSIVLSPTYFAISSLWVMREIYTQFFFFFLSRILLSESGKLADKKILGIYETFRSDKIMIYGFLYTLESFGSGFTVSSYHPNKTKVPIYFDNTRSQNLTFCKWYLNLVVSLWQFHHNNFACLFKKNHEKYRSFCMNTQFCNLIHCVYIVQ